MRGRLTSERLEKGKTISKLRPRRLGSVRPQFVDQIRSEKDWSAISLGAKKKKTWYTLLTHHFSFQLPSWNDVLVRPSGDERKGDSRTNFRMLKEEKTQEEEVKIQQQSVTRKKNGAHSSPKIFTKRNSSSCKAWIKIMFYKPCLSVRENKSALKVCQTHKNVVFLLTKALVDLLHAERLLKCTTPNAEKKKMGVFTSSK